MPKISREQIHSQVIQLLKAYAWILFVNNPYIGTLFLGLSFWQPNIGFAGLLSAVTASILVHYFKFSYRETGIHIFNAILVGLSIGAFYLIDGSLILLIIICATLTVFFTVMLMNILLMFGSLPVLSAPFVLVAVTTAFAAKSFASLSNYFPDQHIYLNWLPDTIINYFTALGSIFFLPDPIVGALLFAGIIWQSRYLAFLSFCGFLVGFNLYEHFSATPHSTLAIYNGFNYSLTAMALGAIYSVPGRISFIIAMTGAAIAALVATAAQSFMALYNLPVMATPFILTTLTLLSALNARQSLSPPWLRLTSPDLPEVHYERARIATYRLGNINSVPLIAPFFGSWQIYQGFNGKHTHQPPWQHALDFIMMESDKSYRHKGEVLDDYYCFGLPVKSPCYGTVVRVFDDLPDNIPGEVDVKNNWGNFILIRLDSGLFVLLAHLKQHSIKVAENDHVEPGKVIAACGNSGRSPQPHLHLQVQTAAILGSPTYPFHLASVNLKVKEKTSEFKMVVLPQEKDTVTPLEIDAELANALHLPVGRSLCYEYYLSGKHAGKRKLHVTLSLLGEFRLVSDSGASAAFQESNGMLAFYDRQGPQDKFLDMWLLSLGLTPFAADVTNWQDSPSSLLLPATWRQIIFRSLTFPLGTGLDSRYHRQFDRENDVWIQQGKHTLSLGLETLSAATKASLNRSGCVSLEMQTDNRQWKAILLDIDREEDIGILHEYKNNVES